MLDVWGMDPQRKVNQITREERRRLVELLKAFPVELAGKGDLAHAVVTSGGVSVKEVDPKTMQSKLCPGQMCIRDSTGNRRRKACTCDIQIV